MSKHNYRDERNDNKMEQTDTINCTVVLETRDEVLLIVIIITNIIIY